MSILSALKARGAKGKNIEEAVKTLPIGGGSGGGVLVVNATMEGATITFDKTWQQIYDAPYAVGVIVTEQGDDILKMYVSITQTSVEQGVYKVYAVLDGSDSIFIANSADGYPSFSME